MCQHDHFHVLKLSTCQGHCSVGQLHFAHLFLFRWLTKTVWNFLRGWGHRICCLVGTSSFLFLCWHCGGSISSCRPCYLQNPCWYSYVGVWFVSDIDGSWKRIRCWYVLTVLLNPTTTQAALPICSMSNSLSLSSWKKLPNMVWAIFNGFASFKKMWLTGAMYGWSFFLSVTVMCVRKGIMLRWTDHVSFEKFFSMNADDLCVFVNFLMEISGSCCTGHFPVLKFMGGWGLKYLAFWRCTVE